jgi:hypothetical protein
MLKEAAPIMYKSRLFGVATEDQAVAIMVKGHELGLGLATSFEYIQVIQGKPTLIPRGALALAYQSGLMENFTIVEQNDAKGQPYSCTVGGNRIGGTRYTVTFTMDDAQRAGLVKDGSGWISYPANMLKWRAIGFWLDIVLPDIQGGMKRADEFGAMVDAGGNVIDAVSMPVQTAPAEPVRQMPTIEQLITRYGVDNVMDAITAQGGTMPSTDTEIMALEDVLKIQAEVTNG